MAGGSTRDYLSGGGSAGPVFLTTYIVCELISLNFSKVGYHPPSTSFAHLKCQPESVRIKSYENLSVKIRFLGQRE